MNFRDNQFEAIFNQPAVGIMLSAPDRSRFRVNKKLCDIVGHSLEQFAQLEYADFIHPEDLQPFMNDFQRLEDGTLDKAEREVRLLVADGSETWAFTTNSLVRGPAEEPDYFVVVFEHIWRRVELVEQHRQSEERFRNFAEASSDWFWETDPDQVFTYVSPTVEKILGTPSASLIGKKREDLISEEFDPIARERHIQTLEQRRRFRDFKYLAARPEKRWISVSGVPVFDPVTGEFIGYRGTGRDVTHIENLATRQQRIENAFRAVVNGSPVGITLKDRDGRFVLINDTFADWLGIDPTSFMDKTTYELHGKSFADDVARRDRKVLADGEPVISRQTVTFSNGETRHLISHKYPVRDAEEEIYAVATIVNDITELEDVESRLNAIFNGVPVAISLKNLDGRFLMVNDTHAAWLGMTPEAAVGSHASDFYLDEQLADIAERDRRALETGETVVQEKVLKFRNGSARHVVSFKAPIRTAAGEIFAVATILNDVSALKAAEAKVIQADKLASLGRMATGITHELAQPLNIINMTIDDQILGIDDGEYDLASVRAALDGISVHCQRMANTISHMAMFSRMDDTEPEVFAVGAVLKNAVEMLERPYASEGVNIFPRFPEDCGHVLGHSVQLEQVLINLMANAKDSIIGASGGAIGGAPADITLSCTPQMADGTIEISVRDTGTGISEHVLPDVFDAFFTTKEAGKGTGLGLAISLEIINSMGGTIDVSSSQEGACFSISLPPASLSNDRGADAQPASLLDRRNEMDSRAYRVMVVDDETHAADGVAGYLRRHGFRVEIAYDGADALTQFAANPADLLVTDLRMPSVRGEDLIRELRSSQSTLPVVVVSGELDAKQRLNAIPDHRSVRLLGKPLNLRELSDTIDELLNSHGAST